MLKNLFVYSIFYLTQEESDIMFHGEISEKFKEKDNSRILFVKKFFNINCSMVFTIERDVPIYHGILNDELITWLTKTRNTNDYNYYYMLGPINSSFAPSIKLANERYTEISYQYNFTTTY